MLGQMMHRPLCTSTILTHARTAFPEARVISRMTRLSPASLLLICPGALPGGLIAGGCGDWQR